MTTWRAVRQEVLIGKVATIVSSISLTCLAQTSGLRTLLTVITSISKLEMQSNTKDGLLNPYQMK
jgi:hypothetical protein